MNFSTNENEIKFLKDALARFNENKVGKDGHTPLNIVEYDNDGSIIAGIVGGTYWGWLYIDTLWVHEAHRHKGLGSRLLCEAEKEALRRGCHHAHLDTMSWQAPNFYKIHGYKVIDILDSFPGEHQKYLLIKAL